MDGENALEAGVKSRTEDAFDATRAAIVEQCILMVRLSRWCRDEEMREERFASRRSVTHLI